MHITAINAGFSGTGYPPRHSSHGDGHSGQRLFSSSHRTPPSHALQSEVDIESALQRALARLEVLVGAEMAEHVVHEDGSINTVRLLQALNAASAPHGQPFHAASAQLPHVVDVVA